MNKKIVSILIAIGLCLVAGFIGSFATQTSIDTWYVSLNKPSFNPPNWLFAPVWTVLFILMGVGAGLVFNKGFHHKWVQIALYYFGFQLLINIAWSVFFFGLQNPLLALLDIILLLILIVQTIKRFHIVNTTAAYLLVPYLIWVGFATVLNFKIWQLN